MILLPLGLQTADMPSRRKLTVEHRSAGPLKPATHKNDLPRLHPSLPPPSFCFFPPPPPRSPPLSTPLPHPTSTLDRSLLLPPAMWDVQDHKSVARHARFKRIAQHRPAPTKLGAILLFIFLLCFNVLGTNRGPNRHLLPFCCRYPLLLLLFCFLFFTITVPCPGS